MNVLCLAILFPIIALSALNKTLTIYYWNQIFFVAYFCVLESFFQNSKKRKEKEKKI